MDNHLLTTAEASNGAGFNRLPFNEADFKVNEINDLETYEKQLKNNSWQFRIAVHKIDIVHNSPVADVIRMHAGAKSGVPRTRKSAVSMPDFGCQSENFYTALHVKPELVR